MQFPDPFREVLRFKRTACRQHTRIHAAAPGNRIRFSCSSFSRWHHFPFLWTKAIVSRIMRIIAVWLFPFRALKKDHLLRSVHPSSVNVHLKYVPSLRIFLADTPAFQD